MTVNRRILLASRPEGDPALSNFKLAEESIPTAGPGQMLLKTLWLSLDPYMRGRMSAAKSYASPVELDQVMVGGTVSEVVTSNNPNFRPGDIVVGYTGWQNYYVTDGEGFDKVDSSIAPISTALGVLGMPGMTAYMGLLKIGQPKSGETVVVAAASGAVGAIVGQIAKLRGCRVVGIAGGAEKCAYITKELGFDAAVDHRSPNFKDDLKAACPDGIDVYFENVGGDVFRAVLPLLNNFARVPVCGLIAHYNDSGAVDGPDRTRDLMYAMLAKRITFRGFIIWDFNPERDEFIRDMSQWVKNGQIKYREDIVEGLENAPEAFLGLLKGQNFGKLVVKVA